MKNNRFLSVIGFLFIVFSTFSCTTFQGQYGNPDDVDIIDDKWNETDARVTAEKVVAKMLTKPWLTKYIDKKKARPIVIVGIIDNRTDEHIDTKTFVEYISDELINSGKVRFIEGEKRQAYLTRT